MILDALKKASNSLNTTSKSLVNEDLKSILNIHHFGLSEALTIANNGNKLSNPITYLKFKIIDSVKDLDFSKKILGSYFKQQLSNIDDAISNPLSRKEFLINNMFKPKKEDNYLHLNTFADVISIHEEGMKEGTDKVLSSMKFDNALGVKRKILNPFNDIVFNLEMQTEREHSNHGNRVFTIDTEYQDINSLYVIQLKTNSEKSLNLSSDESYNKLVRFEYTLYHELAHTSYNQMTKTKEEDNNKKEIHSDLCAIIKIIKNHDLNGKDTLNLCKEIFKDRLSSASVTQYFDQKPSLREHFTEIGIIDFTSSISRNIDKLKSLKDNEIGDFVETFMQESMKRDPKILPAIDDKALFVNNLLDNYLKENIGESLTSQMDSHIHAEIVKTKFYEKGQFKVKDLYLPETAALAYDKIKANMFNSMMNDDKILTDVYLQNKSLKVDAGDLFVDEVIKKMPEGRKLGANVFDKFEEYKKEHMDNSIPKDKNENKIKLKNS